MVELGNIIKNLRTDKHMTQAEFAERLGVTKSAVSSYENGSRLPSYDVLIKMSRIFKVSLDNLLGCSVNTTIDTTGLTRKQINMIQEMVDICKANNALLKGLKEKDYQLFKSLEKNFE